MYDENEDAAEPFASDPAGLPAPLEPGDAEDEAEGRIDGFSRQRKRAFLRALKKTGSITDAAAAIGISRSTVYRHQQLDPAFLRDCRTGVHMAGHDVELSLWERGVIGVEEPIVAYGKVVGTRIKRSDHILKLLAQGAYPKKYGPRAGFRRKRDPFADQPQISDAEADELRARIFGRIQRLREQLDAEKLAEGWTRHGDDMIPPGWVHDGGEA